MQIESRQGVATILGLILTLALMVVMAITLDFGRIHVAQTELRRSADAAAMAACWEMYDQQSSGAAGDAVEVQAKQAANDYALVNTIIQESSQFSNGDVELGQYDIHGNWDLSDPASFNAVRVTLNRHSNSNGELPLIFGSITGRDTQALSRTATAAMLASISGFQAPSHSDSQVNILPIALDLPSWLDAVASATTDDFAYVNGRVEPGSDGIFETNLYPKGTGAPGNRGTVDIGGANNSTADLSRQILTGISAQDFEDLGVPLVFDENGILELNGDTGISAGIKDELASLIGKTRIIPIYTSVVGNGNNAMFTIVRFEGVRILDVKLTGKKDGKRVIVQPAKVLARNATIDFTGTHTSSHLVTPVMLVE
ncbi:MAG: pilus assembly protein TadG-related protein [Rubripirellula sp.]